MKKVIYLLAGIALIAGVSNGVSPAYAEKITLKADLKGTNEVPPNASPASGHAEATLDTDTKVLTYKVRAKPAKMRGSLCRSRSRRVRSRARRRSRITRSPIFWLANGTPTFIPRPIPGASFAAR
jgi:CHRD domain